MGSATGPKTPRKSPSCPIWRSTSLVRRGSAREPRPGASKVAAEEDIRRRAVWGVRPWGQVLGRTARLCWAELRIAGAKPRSGGRRPDLRRDRLVIPPLPPAAKSDAAAVNTEVDSASL
jgi:hypothetical protein